MPTPSELNSKMKFTSSGKGLKKKMKKEQKKPKTRTQDKLSNSNHLKLHITQLTFKFLKDKWRITN